MAYTEEQETMIIQEDFSVLLYTIGLQNHADYIFPRIPQSWDVTKLLQIAESIQTVDYSEYITTKHLPKELMLLLPFNFTGRLCFGCICLSVCGHYYFKITNGSSEIFYVDRSVGIKCHVVRIDIE